MAEGSGKGKVGTQPNGVICVLCGKKCPWCVTMLRRHGAVRYKGKVGREGQIVVLTTR